MPKFSFEDRTILAIGWKEEYGYEWITTGKSQITKITHKELFCGDYSIHWFEVWKGTSIIARYNAINVDCVKYEDS